MAEASPPAPLSPLDVELDPEFEPQSRPRSCTWPLQRPELQASPAKPAGESTADAASMIPEEEDDEEEGGGSAMTVGSAAPAGAEAAAAAATTAVPEEAARLLAPLPGGGPEGPSLSPGGAAAAGGGGLSGGPAAAPRKCSSRRNAWGNLSYADLITRAIESSPEKRLTLSQIYDWMVRCVPYFKDKGDSNSSAGWKVRRDPGAAPTGGLPVEDCGRGAGCWRLAPTAALRPLMLVVLMVVALSALLFFKGGIKESFVSFLLLCTSGEGY